MKTTLRIQESVSYSYEGFIKKFSMICLKACFILQIRNRVRKKIRGMKKAIWANIRRALAYDLEIRWLENCTKTIPFVRKSAKNKS